MIIYWDSNYTLNITRIYWNNKNKWQIIELGSRPLHWRSTQWCRVGAVRRWCIRLIERFLKENNQKFSLEYFPTEDLLDGSFEFLGHGSWSHDSGDLDNGVNGEVSIVLHWNGNVQTLTKVMKTTRWDETTPNTQEKSNSRSMKIT